MKVRLLVAAIACGSLLSACAGNTGGNTENQSAEGLCISYADVSCDRLYECFSEAQRSVAGLPATLSACKVQTRQSLGCEAVTANGFCVGNETFSSSEAQSCISQWKSASCGQLMDAADETDYAPACGRICAIE